MSTAAPAPFSIDDLFDLVYEAARAAWDADGSEDGKPRPVVRSVTLPEGVLPGLASILNPITAQMIPVERVPLVTIA